MARQRTGTGDLAGMMSSGHKPIPFHIPIIKWRIDFSTICSKAVTSGHMKIELMNYTLQNPLMYTAAGIRANLY